MQIVLAVARREFASYVNSPIAYLVVAVYIIVAGAMFFNAEFFAVGQADMRHLFESAPILFTFMVPFLTMRLLAEERAQGTLELLLTMPITDWQLVVGKFLASIGLIALILVLTSVFAFSVGTLGPLDKGATFAGFIGMFFLCCTYAAIGLMTSALTRTQLIAALIAMFIGLCLWLLGAYAPVFSPGVAPLVNALSPVSHFQNIARGVVDTRDVLYYASVIFGCLLVAQTALESRRWR
jgi:ABC-2 type transport system permease protein